ncbi:MAG TPA: response regulator [Chloroflexi bacterium]|nr:response regulator [Chloroflexota bacterium]
MHSTTRYLILVTGGAYIAWHYVFTVCVPGKVSLPVWYVTPIVVGACGVSLWLLPRHTMLAQAIWQLGLAAGITAGLVVFRQPEVAFLYALLPLLAVVTVGWQAGIVAEALVIGLMTWLRSGGAGFVATPMMVAEVIAAGAFTGLLGWATSHALYTVTEWSLFSLARVRDAMEQAREHRAQLSRALKDLDQAYYRLKRANSALVVAWQAADEAERFKAEFVTSVSHELRTPLNLIIGFSEMMMMAPESYGGLTMPGAYRRDLNAIYRSAQHLLALVDDVLDLARIDAGKIPLTREKTDIGALVADAVAIVNDYIDAKSLELRVNVDGDLPSLWVDRLRLRQVLLNLLVNAARFTERGHISVDVTRQEEAVLVRVIDTGRGIPEADLERIFEEFGATGEPLTAWHSGSGLGLPISKRFVELHGGRMGVDSELLQGTTFWFTIPCHTAGEATALAPRLVRSLPSVPTDLSLRTVVLMHGDESVLRLLQRYLDSFVIVRASDVAEAERLVRELHPLALIMPDGEASIALPASCLRISCPLPNLRRAARILGARDLLLKPVTRDDLMAAIDRLSARIERVLVIDDDSEMVRLLQRMLAARPSIIECMEAHNGREAMELLARWRPDLILLDLVLPELDGHDVLEALRQHASLASIPVIVISGELEESVALTPRAGVCLRKGERFTLAEVMAYLNSVLSVAAPGRSGFTQEAPAPLRARSATPAWGDTWLPPTIEPGQADPAPSTR